MMTRDPKRPKTDPCSGSDCMPLTDEAVKTLKANGCTASDWSKILINPDTDLSLISNCEFEGYVSIGLIDRSIHPQSVIRNALIRNTHIGNGVRIRNISGEIANAEIGDRAVIENTSRIIFDAESLCGSGTRISVLDETGSREVIIYPGLSSQSAMLMARAKKSEAEEIRRQSADYLETLPPPHRIGTAARIIDCGLLHNVSVGNEVSIIGAARLVDGTIVNNADSGHCMAYAGHGVDAESFILEDGAIDSGAIIRNCYIGQGAKIEKGFTAHDSLFFANCAMENGEACALFAGPYTVSMHKGTLLIGCQTSFLNAGSSTNQSNHMYKLGPIHWGVLQRGVKTSSGSYLMLGANIGAFSLLMGKHKTHPDSSEFPFSYLFGDARGATVVVPAVMLRSCGLLRDETKWPARDHRLKLAECHTEAAITAVDKKNHDMTQALGNRLHDKVIFKMLNPVTVEAMLHALEIIAPMLERPADDDLYQRYKGMKLTRASLQRALKLYYLGIMKYLYLTLPEGSEIPAPPQDDEERRQNSAPWIDIAGLPMPRPMLQEAIMADSVSSREIIFNKAYQDYDRLQMLWIASAFPQHIRPSAEDIKKGADEFDRLVEQDRQQYLNALKTETDALAL